MGRFRVLTDAEMDAAFPSPNLPVVLPVPTGISEALRWAVWERDNFTCQACGRRRFLAVDHIYPIARGGLTVLANLQTLCTRCNSAKKDHFGPRAKTLFWQRLVELEPRLGELRAQAAAIRDDGTTPAFCANARFFGYYGHPDLKAVLVTLVGFQANSPDPLLRSMIAYQVAYHRIYDALPDCRNCLCG